MHEKAWRYQLQSSRWDEDWLPAHFLVRGNSAIGDYQTALIYEKETLLKASEVNKGSIIESTIIFLEQGKDLN